MSAMRVDSEPRGNGTLTNARDSYADGQRLMLSELAGRIEGLAGEVRGVRNYVKALAIFQGATFAIVAADMLLRFG
jgi:hypothetical protein